MTDEIDVKTFREVSFKLRELQSDINEVKESLKRMNQLIIGSVVCPLLIGIVVSFVVR